MDFNALFQAQLKKLPDIVFVLKGFGSEKKVEVTMSWMDYADNVGQ